MPITSSTQLVDVLRQFRLIEPGQLQALATELAKFPDAKGLAKELIQRGWLTAFQVNVILQERAKELVFGPYLLIERLGEGGMGQVYKARHRKLDRLVALKVIRKDKLQNQGAVARFEREAKASAKLSHPNIVAVHDADEADGTHFIAMEFIQGTDLDKIIKAKGSLPIEQSCDFIRQAALGLQHAHERGLVHRDIKPANILVSRSDGEGPPLVKILDFGLARVDDESANLTRLTQMNKFVGTVDYIAPEQVENSQKADARSDIFSLGCTLYHLLTGVVPFPGPDMVARLSARLLDDTPSARFKRPDVPAGLDIVLTKMMERNPAHRYQTAAEVAAALEPFTRPAENRQTSLPPRRTIARTTIARKKKRVKVAALLTAAFALVMSAVCFALFMSGKSESKKEPVANAEAKAEARSAQPAPRPEPKPEPKPEKPNPSRSLKPNPSRSLKPNPSRSPKPNQSRSPKPSLRPNRNQSPSRNRSQNPNRSRKLNRSPNCVCCRSRP